MYNGFLSLNKVSYTYDSMATPLFEEVALHIHPGWTGVAGINGAGKTTLLKLAAGLLEPQSGKISGNGGALYCSQRTDDMPGLFGDFLDSGDSAARRLQGRFSILYEWLYRWDTLSFGERKRCQLAVALWQDPGLLAVDEPTNHLDRCARQMVAAALEEFRGIGLLVSHDRELLDRLCSHTLFLSPGELCLRPGGYSAGKEQEEQEDKNNEEKFTRARQEQKRLSREMEKRRAVAAAQQKRRSKRGLDLKDHDARSKKNLARITGKDGVGGKLLRQMDGRMQRADRKSDSFSLRKKRKTGITMAGERPGRDRLFHFSPFVLPLGEERQLEVPELYMLPGDRISLTGGNGAGKSTLINYIVRGLTLSPEVWLFVPQEIDKAVTKDLKEKVFSLDSHARGVLLSHFSRLGSNPDRLLDSALPSPGEARKLLLAFGLMHTPVLIIMDEPTNHLDITSVECLEQAMENSPCGLLLVSHDTYFLDKLTRIRWSISEGRGGGNRLMVDR